MVENRRTEVGIRKHSLYIEKKFIEEFKSKFIPLLEQEKKEDEFINLK